MFKRVSSLVLAVLMVLTMVGSMTAFAADPEAEIVVTVSSDKEQAERGEAVTFTYYVETAKKGISWASLEIKSVYDSARLAVSRVAVTGDATEYNVAGNTIKMVIMNRADTGEKTAVATVTFNVVDRADILNTAATVTAVVVKAGAPDPSVELKEDTVGGSATVNVVCFHKNGTVASNSTTTHAVNCPDCDGETEPCSFIKDMGTVTNVPHGQYAYKLLGCSHPQCTNTYKENLTLVPHKEDGVKALGNKTHQIICKADGAVMRTAPCTFSDSTGCKVTCDVCGAVYDNSNPANAIHSNTNEHYYAPVAAGALGKITDLCKDCGYEKTISTGTWAFADVAQGDWYYHAATFNRAYTIFKGDDAGKFNPNSTISRADAATVLSRMLISTINEAVGRTVIDETALNKMSQTQINAFVDNYLSLYGLTKVSKIPAFSDVPMGEYYGGHVRLMATLGIINGQSATTYEPYVNITREELAALMSRLVEKLEKINGETYASFGAAVGTYSDKSKVSDWATANVEWVRKTGLMKGDENNAFNPGATATRAEVATMMFRVKRTVDHITVHNVPANRM